MCERQPRTVSLRLKKMNKGDASQILNLARVLTSGGTCKKNFRFNARHLDETGSKMMLMQWQLVRIEAN
jgi:hypothetical protein